jgi:hypothetical protein
MGTTTATMHDLAASQITSQQLCIPSVILWTPSGSISAKPAAVLTEIHLAQAGQGVV